MNFAVILAGGVGRRMNMNIPKQYIVVAGKPVFLYSLEKFLYHPEIDIVVLVISEEWREYVEHHMKTVSNRKQILFAPAGDSRQHSVLNGLKVLTKYATDSDCVLIHDAVRPLFPVSNIDDGIMACREYDAALPVISVKDATYQSHDGACVTAILPKGQLFSGQSPECFRFEKYYKANLSLTDEELTNVKGSSELSFSCGHKVKMIKGTEANFKITTLEDLRAFELIIGKRRVLL